MNTLWIGVDTGGTFTDFVALDAQGGLRARKLLSTPDDPSRAVLAGIALLAAGERIDLTYGSTVATNALLERRGARAALVTTAGVEDLLALGRQARPQLYALRVERTAPLLPPERCFGVVERVGPHGEIVQALAPEALGALRDALSAQGVESVAICLLHAYANPAHEEQLAAALAPLGLPVTVSSALLPEHREFERAVTTVVNAYVAPKMSSHLHRLEAGLPGARLRVMQSSGGAAGVARVAREPVRTALSGPAGGVVGAFAAARRAGFSQVIGLDMGGTSTDVSLCDGAPRTTAEGVVAGLPLRVPMLDVHTVGAGGGSIARLDLGGSLRVGPESAGAVPGPACYGAGGPLTVTDANLLTGRLSAAERLGGFLALDEDAARRAAGPLAAGLGGSVEAAAEGVIRVVNAAMEKAVRVISLERGFDPRDFALLAFGGAGALHACALAEELSIPTVLVPPDAGVLSALGMIEADISRELSQSALSGPGRASLDALAARAQDALAAEGFAPAAITVETSADLRYRGQSFEITIPVQAGEEIEEAFHRAYERRYGYRLDRPVEVVTWRARASAANPKPARPALAAAPEDPAIAQRGARPVFVGGRWVEAAVYARDLLLPGMRALGPAIITEENATTWLPPGWGLRVHPLGALVLTPSAA